VPILDNEGNVIFALGLVGPIDEDHSHVLKALTKAADRIIDHLTINQLSQKLGSLSKSLTRVIHRIPEGVIVINSDGIIESVNSEAEKLMNKKASEITGLSFDYLCDKDFSSEKMFCDENYINQLRYLY